MSKLIQGAESLERLALFFGDLMEAKSMLTELGGAEQAKAQFEASAKANKADAEKTKKALDQAKKKLEQIEEACIDRERQTAERCKTLVEEARAAAGVIVEEAKEASTKMIATAKEKVAKSDEHFSATLAKKQAEVDELQSSSEALVASVAIAKKELEDLNKRIAEAKAAAQAAAKALIGD